MDKSEYKVEPAKIINNQGQDTTQKILTFPFGEFFLNTLKRQGKGERENK